MAKKEGFSFINIPYKGTPESQTALMGGHLDLAAGDFTASLAEAGEIRPILMLADARSPMYPNVQCLKEIGVEYPVPAVFLLGAPRDTPASILKILEDGFTQAARAPEYIKGVADLKVLSTYRSSDELARYLPITFERIGEMLKESGLKN